ncbi:MAG: methyltransferase domain-containing protein [Pseudonocardiaceae bacterium]
MTVTAGPDTLLSGLDTTEAVAAAVRAVPREQFLPARIWVQETDEGPYEPIDRAGEFGRWMRYVYAADHAIITQFDDGATPWPEQGWRPSCSASQPAVVVGMLDALDVEPGARVLEIGTGTGYHAALLAELVGPGGRVLTVEVDADLASAARRNLAAAGYQDRVEVLLADGATALAAPGSVDRVIATAAVQLGRLPYAWVAQTRPGGIILVPVRAELASGPLVRLEVGSDGVARGQAVAMRVGFMELRAQRTLGASWSGLRWDDPALEATRTDIDPFTALLHEAPRWAIAVSVPSCRYDLEKRTSQRGHGVAWLLDPITGSWASVVPTTPRSDHYLCRQSGPRRLWDEAATAYRWWDQQGQPSLEAWQWTITPHRQHINLT